MKIISSNHHIEESKQDISKQVEILLDKAGVGDKLPTPREDIIEAAKLIELNDSELPNYNKSIFKKGSALLKKALSKFAALLDFREKIIYVNPEIHPSKHTFATYHEVSHKIFPWHEGLFDPHLDDYYSIDPTIAKGLEQEANIGSSLIIFQLDRFSKDLKDLPIGLASAKLLADRYGSSLHSTFRKYIDDNHKSCVLLVLEEVISNERMLILKYPIQSTKFTDEFGEYDWQKYYLKGHPMFEVAFSNTLDVIQKGELDIFDNKGFKRKCIVEIFNNSYNRFALIFPKPKYKPRTKLVIVEKIAYVASQ